MGTKCISDLQCFQTFRIYKTQFKSPLPTWRTECIEDLQRFQTFRICSLFWTFSPFRNFYSGDAHHAIYGKHSLNHHFRHGAHSVYKIYSVFKILEFAKHSLNHHFRHGAQSVYKIYSVFKLLEFAVCFAHFDFFEISTPVMRIMQNMTTIV